MGKGMEICNKHWKGYAAHSAQRYTLYSVQKCHNNSYLNYCWLVEMWMACSRESKTNRMDFRKCIVSSEWMIIIWNEVSLSIPLWNGTNSNKGDLIVWLHPAPNTQYSLPMYITGRTKGMARKLKNFARIYVLKFQSKCRNSEHGLNCILRHECHTDNSFW